MKNFNELDKIEKFLSSNMINESSSGSLFIRGVREINLDDVNSIFENGIELFPMRSILAKICHLNHQKNYSEQIYNYIGRGNDRILIYIPEVLGSLYLGCADETYGDAGNQYKMHHLIDAINLSYLPTGFIVGIVKDNDGTNEFIQNPNFYIKLKDTKSLENIISSSKVVKENPIIRNLLKISDTESGLQKIENEFYEIKKILTNYYDTESQLMIMIEEVHNQKEKYFKKKLLDTNMEESYQKD